MKTSVNTEKVTLSDDSSFIATHYQNSYFAAPLHRHQEYELIFIHEGNGLSLVGDGVRKLEPGDFMLIGANLPHLWLSADEYYEKDTTLVSRSTYAQFGKHLFFRSIQELPEMTDIKKMLRTSSRGILFHRSAETDSIVKIFCELPEKNGMRRLLSLYEILNLLSECDRYELIATSAYSFERLESSTNTNVQKVLDYINYNYNEQLTLSDIADKVQLHPTTLCRLFKETTGVRLFDKICELRIENATKLLVNTNLSVKQIAYDCGYNYVSFFNKQFKSLQKVSPVEYRKQFRAMP